MHTQGYATAARTEPNPPSDTLTTRTLNRLNATEQELQRTLSRLDGARSRILGPYPESARNGGPAEVPCGVAGEINAALDRIGNLCMALDASASVLCDAV